MLNLFNATVVNLSIIVATILVLYFFLLYYTLKHDTLDSDLLIVQNNFRMPRTIQIIAGIFVGLMAFVISNHGIPIANFRPIDMRYLPVYFSVYYGSTLIGVSTATTLIISKCVYYYVQGGTVAEISNNFLITTVILLISIMITKKKLRPRKAIYLCLGLTILVRSIFFSFAFYPNFTPNILLQIVTNFLIFSLLFLFTGWLINGAVSLSESIQVYRTSAIFDGLTNLYNKKSFYFFLDLAYNEAIHEGRSFSLAIIDLDNFKQINDEFGHLKGDQVLLEVSSLFKDSLSPNSRIRICRIGGDEFAIVFKHEAYNPDDYFETLKKQIEKLAVNCVLKEPLTLSIGLANFKPTSYSDTVLTTKDAQDLFNLADLALYEAKKKGKDQIYQINQDIQIQQKETTT